MCSPLVPVEIDGKKYYTFLIHTEQQKFLRWLTIKSKVARKVKRPGHIV